MLEILAKNRFKVIVSFLLITNAVGLLGILSPYQDSFLNLTFYHLAVTFGLLLLSFYKISKQMLFALAFAFSIGIIAEWIGVHTNILFGEYVYGDNLGPKIWEVPLIIGVNWALLSSISCEMSRVLVESKIGRIVLSASLMVAMDFIIEPIAHVVDFWHWDGNDIPLFNYICWFFIALGVNTVYFRLTKDKENYFSFWIFFSLLIFFLVLNIAL